MESLTVELYVTNFFGGPGDTVELNYLRPGVWVDKSCGAKFYLGSLPEDDIIWLNFINDGDDAVACPEEMAEWSATIIARDGKLTQYGEMT